MFKITLKKNNTKREPMETKDRYDIHLNGEYWGELYYNIDGYVGRLPLANGGVLDCGEQSLSQFRKDITYLNKTGGV